MIDNQKHDFKYAEEQRHFEWCLIDLIPNQKALDDAIFETHIQGLQDPQSRYEDWLRENREVKV